MSTLSVGVRSVPGTGFVGDLEYEWQFSYQIRLLCERRQPRSMLNFSSSWRNVSASVMRAMVCVPRQGQSIAVGPGGRWGSGGGRTRHRQWHRQRAGVSARQTPTRGCLESLDYLSQQAGELRNQLDDGRWDGHRPASVAGRRPGFIVVMVLIAGHVWLQTRSCRVWRHWTCVGLRRLAICGPPNLVWGSVPLAWSMMCR
jgi:hypothetical protein